ncbi:hypothetical protein ZWY2020_016837 [Hordeum vulgare]|nr:hypothetical protein ZWY2020_016837 [Hordeum vulgare]
MVLPGVGPLPKCLIFDGPDADARLIGLEYIIVEELFLTLPDEEKPLWHTHEFEVRGGVLFMRVVPGVVERRDLEKVARTYGKTVHFWQVDRGDALPLGVPQIMKALAREGQLRQDLADCVERKFGVSFQKDTSSRCRRLRPWHAIQARARSVLLRLPAAAPVPQPDGQQGFRHIKRQGTSLRKQGLYPKQGACTVAAPKKDASKEVEEEDEEESDKSKSEINYDDDDEGSDEVKCESKSEAAKHISKE